LLWALLIGFNLMMNANPLEIAFKYVKLLLTRYGGVITKVTLLLIVNNKRKRELF